MKQRVIHTEKYYKMSRSGIDCGVSGHIVVNHFKSPETTVTYYCYWILI